MHIDRLKESVNIVRSITQSNLERSKLTMKDYYEKNKNISEKPYEVNQKIWIYDKTPEKGHLKKLSSLWHGPFYVEKVITPSTYIVRSDKKILPHPVNHRRTKLFINRDEIPKETPDLEEIDLPILTIR